MAIPQPNTGSNIEVAKLQTFNGKISKILGFLTICKLYIRIRMREMVVEEQIQWVFLYIQGELADIWKENVIKNLKSEELEYITIEEFLMDLKKEFGREDNKTMKMTDLKKVEQESRTIKKFV